MFGGYVAWEMGTKEDGSDSVAVQIATDADWSEMRAIILVVSDAKKGTASSDGMQRTVATSPLLQYRIKDVVPVRMGVMSDAIRARDFATFAKETMRDSNSFHAVCLDTSPPIFYLNDVSRNVMTLVEEMNRVAVGVDGVELCAYTFDAGPNAVIYVLEKNEEKVLNILQNYFPQSSSPAASTSALSAALEGLTGFKESVIPVAEVNAVSRIIRTKVGDGPRVLDARQSLLGDNGLPKLLV